MPMGLPGILLAKNIFTSPPIYLAVLGLFLVFMGGVFDVSTLIALGVMLTISGFCLSIFWKIIDNHRKVKLEKKKD